VLSSLSATPGLPLARLSQNTSDSFPGIQLRPPFEPESDLQIYLTEQFAPKLSEGRLGKLLRQSMDAELFADTKSGAASKQTANSLLRGTVKAAYSFAILQEQQNLLGLPARQTLGQG
jgi:hypothetical protein